MNKKIIVNKFGGGILNKKLIPYIEKRLKDQIKDGANPIVVVSALPSVTDSLVDILSSIKKGKKTTEKGVQTFIQNTLKKHYDTMSAIGMKELYKENASKELWNITDELSDCILQYIKEKSPLYLEDKIISYGEQLSATLFTYFLQNLNIDGERILAQDIPIITDDHYKNANIDYKISSKNVIKKIGDKMKVVVIPGFTGINEYGHTTTLGRGGTDTTACFIGASLKADKVILWKDVSGVLSADPRIVKEAKTIPYLSYQEAEEAGKIIHDKAIQYSKMSRTPIEITSLENPKFKTIVGPEKKSGKRGTKIVSYKKNLKLFILTDETIKGSEMFDIASTIFVKEKVDVLLISNTRYSLQIVTDENNEEVIEKVYKNLDEKIDKIEMYDVSMVYLVGDFDVNDVNKFNSLLTKIKADMEISAFLYKDCTRLEAIIKTNKVEKIIQALHKNFIK